MQSISISFGIDMKKIYWTRIYADPFFAYAFKHMRDSTNAYHNIDHIWFMYEYLHKTNEPYNYGLDVAVLFHDFIYDKHPHKEYRSALAMNDYFAAMEDAYPTKNGFSNSERLMASKAFQMIKATESHLVLENYASAIIRADLAGLANRVTAFQNYYKVLEESKNLYGVSEESFAVANLNFMEGLRYRVKENMKLDPDWKDFYTDVLSGIDTTWSLSNVILGKNVPVAVE